MKGIRIIKGLVTFVPGLYSFLRKISPGGTGCAKFCYQVWFNHLERLWQAGCRNIPETVAEIGPGTSIGAGLCALLSSSNHYYAVDKAQWASTEQNLEILEQLVGLFKTRAPVPTGKPPFTDYTEGRPFPKAILTDEILEASLAEERIEAIRAAIKGAEAGDTVTINYVAPWNDERVIPKESVDLLFSHSVMEHVEDPEELIRIFSVWMKPGALTSQSIDMSAHQFANKWNGHWSYSRCEWFLIKGKRAYAINRLPYTWYLKAFEKAGFEIIGRKLNQRPDGISRSELASNFKHLTDEELACNSLKFQARKPLREG